jgi:ferritin-like metal-binding protein YciE
MPMAEKNLKDLLFHTLKDVYFAEHEILKALPKMAQAAQRAELKEAFETHRMQTEQQVQRLKDVFALLDQQPQSEPCKAIQGIIAEGQEVMETFAGGPALGAGLIAAAQAVEHYEIARYGTLSAWARQLDLTEVADLIEESLEEEADMDDILSEMAEAAINPEAV